MREERIKQKRYSEEGESRQEKETRQKRKEHVEQSNKADPTKMIKCKNSYKSE